MSEWGDVYINITDPSGYMRGWEGWDHPERKYVLSLVSDNESFLDVGCGGGITYESIIKLGRDIDYMGIDYSEKFINACKEMFPQAKWGISEATKLKEKNSSFDVVYLRNMLENCHYYDVPIKEAFRVARRLVIMTFWQPLQNTDRLVQLGDRTWGNNYGKRKFFKFLKTFGCHISFRFVNVPCPEGQRQLSRYVYVLYKQEPYKK